MELVWVRGSGWGPWGRTRWTRRPTATRRSDMAYDSYRDSNGVRWSIPPAIGQGWTMLAYVDDAADPKYNTPPPDMTASMPEPSDAGTGVPHPTDEQTRVIFLDLRGKIEAYAKEHRGEVQLRVTASAIPWWVW